MPQTIEQKHAAKRRRILRHAERIFFREFLGLEEIAIGCRWGRVGEDGMWALPYSRYEELWFPIRDAS